jgi:Tfp pilus assembly protein PilO
LRRLTKTEARLAWLLGAALFIMANFYGLGFLLDRHSELSQKISELNATRRSDLTWLRERDLWLKRKQWLDTKQPKAGSSEAPQSELLQMLTKSAADHQLQIQEQGFGEAKNAAFYRSVAVRLKLTGSLENVMKWLASVQQPELFQAITSFSLKSENEPPSVSLELEVARWYAPQA